ncbi:hypothetical protein L1887_09157 [Cichorium endivia]|nr:hypothetical protein L1887_09157 [Cichorium endivia]
MLPSFSRVFPKKNKEKINTLINHCLALFAENPTANWKYKDCVIYLVATTDAVEVESFFKSVIIPELQGQDVNAFPMLKAGALKFFTNFHVLIPKHEAMRVLGDVVRYLDSDISAVHSYAASCIEKLLLVKDKNGVCINPIPEDLLRDLVIALKKNQESTYIMRCIVSVLQMADLSCYLVSFCIAVLTTVLTWFPENPKFNHFLFEAFDTLVRRACEKDPSQLVDLNGPCVTPPLYYMQTFDMFLGTDLWDKPVNVPALVRFLQSVLQLAPDEVNREGRLRRVVLVFDKLVSSPTTEEEGFRILNTVIENCAYGVIAEHMNHIWASMLTLLQNSKTPRLVRCVIIFMCVFLVKHGVQTLVDLINSVKADSFDVILSEVWIPNLKTINGYTEVKLCAVASTKLLCESALLLDPAAEELWVKLLDAIVTLLSRPEEERVEDDDFDFGGYEDATFVRLRNVGKKEEDPLKEIKDPKQFFVGFPAKISSEFHGSFPQVIMTCLSPPNRAALVELCNSYNIVIM